MSITALESDYRYPGEQQEQPKLNQQPPHFIKGSVSISISLDTLPLSKSLLESFAKSQSTVFGRVVVINVKVALALQLERHATVLCERCEHLDPFLY